MAGMSSGAGEDGLEARLEEVFGRSLSWRLEDRGTAWERAQGFVDALRETRPPTAPFAAEHLLMVVDQVALLALAGGGGRPFTLVLREAGPTVHIEVGPLPEIPAPREAPEERGGLRRDPWDLVRTLADGPYFTSRPEGRRAHVFVPWLQVA